MAIIHGDVAQNDGLITVRCCLDQTPGVQTRRPFFLGLRFPVLVSRQPLSTLFPSQPRLAKIQSSAMSTEPVGSRPLIRLGRGKAVDRYQARLSRR